MADSKIILSKDLMDKIVEELTEYRAIGTVETLKSLQDDYWKLNEICKMYSEIGTVGELKALKATRKMIEKSNFCLEQYKAYTDTAYQCGYNKAIDEFYDEILNFEDYIEPVDTSDFGAALLYSGIDITNMIVKIKEQMKAGGV